MRKVSGNRNTYTTFARHERQPSIIMVADIRQEMRDRNPYAVMAPLAYEPAGNGFPSRSDLNRLSEIEDRLIDALTQSGFIHAGHVTGNGQMRVVLYGPANGPASIVVKTGIWSKTNIELESRHDPDWQVYEQHLQPTELEYESVDAWPLLKKLAEMGDDPSKSRVVDFAALFPMESQRQAFIEEVAGEGYSLTETGTWDIDGLYWCELCKETSLEPEAIHPKTAYLRRTAKKYDGILDGWQTPLTK